MRVGELGLRIPPQVLSNMRREAPAFRFSPFMVPAIHGAGGGHDQGLANVADLVGDDFRVIAPSRFRYLRTPVPSVTSSASQADAHAALLTEQKVDKAIVAPDAGLPIAPLSAHRPKCRQRTRPHLAADEISKEPHVRLHSPRVPAGRAQGQGVTGIGTMARVLPTRPGRSGNTSMVTRRACVDPPVTRVPAAWIQVWNRKHGPLDGLERPRRKSIFTAMYDREADRRGSVQQPQ